MLQGVLIISGAAAVVVGGVLALLPWAAPERSQARPTRRAGRVAVGTLAVLLGAGLIVGGVLAAGVPISEVLSGVTPH